MFGAIRPRCCEHGSSAKHASDRPAADSTIASTPSLRMMTNVCHDMLGTFLPNCFVSEDDPQQHEPSNINCIFQWGVECAIYELWLDRNRVGKHTTI